MSEVSDLLVETLDDSLLISNDACVGDFLLPLNVSFLEEFVLLLKGSEGALKSDVAFLVAVDVSEDEDGFIGAKGADINGERALKIFKATEKSSKFR